MAVVITAGAVDLDREGRDPAYVESIVKRSQKIVDKLELTDTVAAREVTTIIANRYFKLNDIYETRDAKVKLAKETLTGDAKQEAVKAAEAEKDAALYRTHFAFPADLSLYLDAKQIDAVKDGMTYGVVMVTYKPEISSYDFPSKRLLAKTRRHSSGNLSIALYISFSSSRSSKIPNGCESDSMILSSVISSGIRAENAISLFSRSELR